MCPILSQSESVGVQISVNQPPPDHTFAATPPAAACEPASSPHPYLQDSPRTAPPLFSPALAIPDPEPNSQRENPAIPPAVSRRTLPAHATADPAPPVQIRSACAPSQ